MDTFSCGRGCSVQTSRSVQTISRRRPLSFRKSGSHGAQRLLSLPEWCVIARVRAAARQFSDSVMSGVMVPQPSHISPRRRWSAGAPVSKNPESVQHLSQDSAATAQNQPNRSYSRPYSMMITDDVKSRSRHSRTTSNENQTFEHFFGVGH